MVRIGDFHPPHDGFNSHQGHHQQMPVGITLHYKHVVVSPILTPATIDLAGIGEPYQISGMTLIQIKLNRFIAG